MLGIINDSRTLRDVWVVVVRTDGVSNNFPLITVYCHVRITYVSVRDLELDKL